MNFRCAELLGNTYKYNLWGEHICNSITESITIQGRITGDILNDDVTHSWNSTNTLINDSSGVVPIYVNNFLLGTGRVISIDFDTSTDITDKIYIATIEIERLSGPGIYVNTGSNSLTSEWSGLYDFFYTETGRLILGFTENFSFDNVGSGKYNYNRNISFSIKDEINDIYGVSPGDYAHRILNSVKYSYCDINTITSFYPDFYKSGSGISFTSQSFDEINNKFSFSENFQFSTGLNYTWNYVNNISLNDGVFSISENGEIISNRESSYFNRLSQAELAWSSIETGIFTRCLDVMNSYTGVFLYTGDCSLKNMPESSQTSRDFCLGKISYSRSYSNNKFNNSGYIHSYGTSIDTDNDGYLRLTENGSFQANPRSSMAFSEVYDLYVNELTSISGRVYDTYTGYNSLLYTCGYTGDLYEYSKNIVIEEYDKKISYSVGYTDNILFNDPSYFSFNVSTSDNIPTHIYHYFPVVNDKIYSHPGFQSSRGSFSNSVTIECREERNISEYIAITTGQLSQPSGTDVIPKSFSWSYEPLSNVFTANVTYTYTRYREENNFLV